MGKKASIENPDLVFFKFLKTFFISLSIWNLLALVFAVTTNLLNLNKSTFPSSFGDYLRGDLFLLLVQGNFSNPYEFHSEVPALRNQPYLPFPFLLIKLLGVKINFFEQNLIWVHALILCFFAILTIAIYKILSNSPKQILFLFLFSIGFLSPSSLYLFTTGNIQILIVALCLVSLVVFKSEKTSKTTYFLANFLIVSTKPQFSIINFMRAITTRANWMLYTGSVISGIIFSLWGFFHFDRKFRLNLDYWLMSLNGFVDSSPEYVVHNNASIIGNLSSLELFFFPERIDKLFTIQSAIWIVVSIFVLSLFMYYRAFEIDGTSWLQLWILVSIATLLIPVSFTYNLALFMAPLCVLISNSSDRQVFTKKILNSRLYSILFSMMLLMIFATKPVHVWLIEGRADTNLYNMMNALSLFLFMAIYQRILKKN